MKTLKKKSETNAMLLETHQQLVDVKKYGEYWCMRKPQYFIPILELIHRISPYIRKVNLNKKTNMNHIFLIFQN